MSDEQRAASHLRYANRLQRIDPDEFLAVAAKVRELEEHPGFLFLMQHIEETEAGLIEELLFEGSEAPPDRVLVETLGRIGALRESRELVTTVRLIADRVEAKIKQRAADADAARDQEDSRG